VIKRYREAKMAEPRAEIFYRAASIIAGLIALLAIANTIYNISEGEPVIPVVALALAGLVWLIGWLCRSKFGRADEVIE
jgi:hypothetical protein